MTLTPRDQTNKRLGRVVRFFSLVIGVGAFLLYAFNFMTIQEATFSLVLGIYLLIATDNMFGGGD